MLRNLLIIIFLSQCITKSLAQENAYSLTWDNHQARSILIKHQDVEVKVRLKGRETFIPGKSVYSPPSGILFTPVIPFTNDLEYEVVSENSVLFTFKPQAKTEAPQVLNIYPQSNMLPENFLKFYIEFDQPMGVAKLYDHIQLLRNKEEVPGAFLKLQPELWDESNKVVTLWIDPGRIKTDLGPNIYQGPVLTSGNSYRLVIDTGIVSASGQHLKEQIFKDFEVINRDNQSPDLSKWKIIIPVSETNSPLIIRMTEKMDHAIVDHIQINENESDIDGDFELQNDSILIFKPANSWYPGRFKLMVESITEDLAGNNLDRLFEVDVRKNKAKNNNQHSLNFTIK